MLTLDPREKIISRICSHVKGIDPLELAKLRTDTLKLILGRYDDLIEDLYDYIRGENI